MPPEPPASLPALNRSTSSRWRLGNVAVILAIIALVATPWVRSYFVDHAIPRWYLAYAAVAADRGDVSGAKNALDRAWEQDPTLANDQAYWDVRFSLLSPRAKSGSPSEEASRPSDADVDALIIHVIESLQEDSSLAFREKIARGLADRLMHQGFFSQSVNLMEASFPPISKRGPVLNNLLAYARALANVNLEVALDEVNRALRDRSSDKYTLQDTKAWILFRMEEFEEAVELSNKSIDGFYANLRGVSPNLWLAFGPDEELADWMKVDEAERLEVAKKLVEERVESLSRFSQAAVANSLSAVAVIRHHRALILEALSRNEEADREHFWLAVYGFDDTSELF